MRDFRKYTVWEKSHQFTLEVYKLAANLPQDEKFGLASQLKRAAYSITLNFVEGAGRLSDKDFARFVSIAIGSANEVAYIFELMKDLKFIESNNYDNYLAKVIEVRKMLISLHKKLLD